MAVVDVTNPKESKLVASVPHSDGLWSDIKVYKDTAYVSTETSGTGIQVIDLSKIDDGKATLIRTITTPGRSHTIALDEKAGFLYTCGSNEGVSKGATTCFDLKDPHDPKRVGAPTLTPVYQHESQVVTYDSGKYKGRTIFFGGGEGRGLEIWDVTDKDKPFLVKRVAYPFVGYCHQGWLSANKKYFYVNDEFDESTNSIATRTLVFDVSDLDFADLVSTYTTGRSSIDHNLYTRNDFIFHANYTTGLWIFNSNENPQSPKVCGFFDTFPADDNPHFDGAWSNYPFLPSGTVLISDINQGLFVVDASEATRTPFPVTKMADSKSDLSIGDLLSIDEKAVAIKGSGSASFTFEGKCNWTGISKLAISLTGRSMKGEVSGHIEFYNFATKAYEQKSVVKWSANSAESTINVKDPNKYLDPASKSLRAKLTIANQGTWSAQIDQAQWILNP